MAKLTSSGLSLEITFGMSARDYILYRVRFLWKDKSIVNGEILRGNDGKPRSRHRSHLYGDEYRWDTLLATLERFLDSYEPQFWHSLNPDLTLALYPEWGIPWRGHSIDIPRKKTQVSANDFICLMLLVDAEQFAGSNGAYTDQGIALVLNTNRMDFEAFVRELNSEWDAADAKHHYAELWKEDDEERT